MLPTGVCTRWLQVTLKRSEDKTSACNGCRMNLRGGQGNKSGKGGRAAAARSGFPPFTPGCAGLWWTRHGRHPNTYNRRDPCLALPDAGDSVSTAATAPSLQTEPTPLCHQHTARRLSSSCQVLYLSSLPFPSNPIHLNSTESIQFIQISHYSQVRGFQNQVELSPFHQPLNLESVGFK